MPEQTITIPLEGANVTPQQQAPMPTQERPESGFQNNQYVPPSKRMTLHNTRLGVAMAKQAEAKAQAAAPEPQPQPHIEALMGELRDLKSAVSGLVTSQRPAPERESATLEQLRLHNQYGDGTPYTGDSPTQQYSRPDITEFGFFDEQDAADFRLLNNDYIQQEVKRQVEAERTTQRQAAHEAEINRQGEAVRAKFGRDANFDETLLAACDLIIQSGYKLTAEDAYLRASDEIEAKSGQRRSTFLPEDVKTLGQIMRYREQTGRARR